MGRQEENPTQDTGPDTPYFRATQGCGYRHREEFEQPALNLSDSNGGDEQVLTPNVLKGGQNAHPIEGEEDEEETSALNKRLREAKNHAWKRWRHEYVHSLMETHRITCKVANVPDIGDIVLIVADEKNRGEWKKGKVVRHIQGKDYCCFTGDTTLTDRLTSCAHWKYNSEQQRSANCAKPTA